MQKFVIYMLSSIFVLFFSLIKKKIPKAEVNDFEAEKPPL